MFEDVDDILKGKRRKQPSNDEEAKRPNFNSNRGFDSNNLGNVPTPEEIQEALTQRFGGEVEVIPVGGGNLIGMPVGSMKKDKLRSEGLMETLVYIAQELKLPPSCKDIAGNELKVGDTLKVPGGQTKTVLKLGWKFVNLSKTDDQTKDDGVWFENEINNGNFIKV